MKLKWFTWSCLCSWVLADDLLHPFTVQVQPWKKDCFYEDVPSNIQVDFVFEVAEGPDFYIPVLIMDPLDQIIYRNGDKQEDMYSFITDTPGSYSFCFDNAQESSIKEVNFNIIIRRGKTSINGHLEAKERSHLVNDVLNKEKTTSRRILSFLDEIDGRIDSIAKIVDHMGLEQHRLKYVGEGLLHSVSVWNMLKVWTAVVWTGLQVLAVRRFFEYAHVSEYIPYKKRPTLPRRTFQI